MSGSTSKRYPVELRERAVRMVGEVRSDHDSERAAMTQVAQLLGVGTPETIRKWCRQGEVDAGGAKAESPFRGPVAHGYLTLSLLVPMWKQLLVVTDAALTVNYGLDRVHFPSPVPAGSRVRLTATIKEVHEVTGGVQVVGSAVMMREQRQAGVRGRTGLPLLPPQLTWAVAALSVDDHAERQARLRGGAGAGQDGIAMSSTPFTSYTSPSRPVIRSAIASRKAA